MWFMTDRLTESTEDAKLRALRASERLLAHIAGGRKTAAAFSEVLNTSDSAKKSGSEDAVGTPVPTPDRQARPARGKTVRTLIGVEWQTEAVVMARGEIRQDGTPLLAGLKRISIDENRFPTLTDKATFAAEAVKKFAPDVRRCEVWADFCISDSAILKLPRVEGEALDAVAGLHLAKSVKFDDTTQVFDYRVQGDLGEKALSALAVCASQSDIADIQAAFRSAGVPLKGLTSGRFAVKTLIADNPFYAMPWNQTMVLQFTPDITIISILNGRQLALQRTISWGHDLFYGDLIRRLESELDLSAMSPEEAYNEAFRRARGLLESGQRTPEEEKLIDDAMSGSLDRVLKYIERTVNYYRRVENGPEPEGLLAVVGSGLRRAIGEAVDDAFGMETRGYSLNESGEIDADTFSTLLHYRNDGRSFQSVGAAGLALVNDRIPNLLEPPAVRRRAASQKRYGRIVLGSIAAVCAVTAGLAAWQGLRWFEAKNELASQEAVKASIGRLYTADDLYRLTGELTRAEQQAENRLKRRRFAALLVELGEVRVPQTYFKEIRVEPSQSSESRRARNAKQEEPKLPQTAVVLTVDVLAKAKEREAVLADLIGRLEARFPTLKLNVNRTVGNETGSVVIRMEGAL